MDSLVVSKHFEAVFQRNNRIQQVILASLRSHLQVCEHECVKKKLSDDETWLLPQPAEPDSIFVVLLDHK